MKAKFSDFTKEGDTVLDRVDYPLFRAMAAGVKELEVMPDEFVLCMRYAVMSHVYWQEGGVPYILGMKIKVV